MATKLQLFLSLLLINCLGTRASANSNLDQLVAGLEGIKSYKSKATFEVLIPQSSEPIVYELSLTANDNVNDNLSPCDYIVEWTINGGKSDSSGFSAYHNGNHYRYRDNKLLEYHMEWDSIPFRSDNIGQGVQNQALFVKYLPANLAEHIKRISNDTTYYISTGLINVSKAHSAIVVKGTHTIADVVCEEFEYVFDRKTALPIRIHIESNPASISEQTIDVKYSESTTDVDVPITDEALMESYPIVFEKYRQCNYHIKNLIGEILPEFSAQTIGGSHYSFKKGDTLNSPTMFAVLDTKSEYSKRIISNIRLAYQNMPFESKIVWIFSENNKCDILKTIDKQLNNEEIYINSHSFIQKCGITSTPTTILANRNGKIIDVIIGFSKDLPSIITQNLSMAINDKN